MEFTVTKTLRGPSKCLQVIKIHLNEWIINDDNSNKLIIVINMAMVVIIMNIVDCLVYNYTTQQKE